MGLAYLAAVGSTARLAKGCWWTKYKRTPLRSRDVPLAVIVESDD